MRNTPSRILRKKYSGEANGIIFMVKFFSNGHFLASIESSYSDRRKSYLRGQTHVFSGFLSTMSDWIDSMIWEDASVRDDVEFLETNNGKIAYNGYNTHLKGTPVVFLHGGPGDYANTVKPRMMMLDCPVYCYDQLGCGKSDPIPDLTEWNHENYFDELNEFITGMGFDRVTLIGASWGAGLAAGYAEKYGCGHIEKMVLVSPFLSSKTWETDQVRNLDALPEYEREQILKYIDGKISKKDCEPSIAAYLSKYLFTRECNRPIAEEASRAEPNDVFKALCGDNDFKVTGTMKDFDLVPGLGKITSPALLMCGDSDEVRTETLISFAEKIEKSRISVVPFAGHALSHEQFEIYSQTIRDFLSE